MHDAIARKVEEGADAVIVCPTRVYGPGARAEGNAVTRAIELYLRGRLRALPGDGARTGNYVYIDDVVEGHVLAMQKGRTGEAYILGGDNVSYRALFGCVAEISGKRRRLYPIPIPALAAFAWTELKRAEWFGRRPLITPAWVRRYSHDWANSSAKAERELGYAPRSLREGLALTIAWLNGGDGFQTPDGDCT